MKRILIIEDNREIRENIAEILELEGYQVFSASSGRIGVEIAFAKNPDLIFCDIMMPDLDGYATLYLLGKNKDTMNIPFIFLTARTEKAEIQKGLGLGATNYIVKPFTDTDLLRAVQSGIQKASQISTAQSCTVQELTEFINYAKTQYGLPLSKDEISRRICRKNEMLFVQHDQPVAAYFVIDGKIRSYLWNEEGSQFTTNTHRNGEFLGYMAIMESSEHKDNAIAEEDSSIIMISSHAFLQLMHYDHSLGKKFIKLLAGDNIRKEERLISLAYYSFRKGIIEKLLSFSKEMKESHREPELWEILEGNPAMHPGRDNDYAAFILDDLKTANLIDIRGKKIIIKEEKQLKRILNPNI
ncbi:MAG TPA: response regulator [Puia sp.]|nr:response regulator [Puia sp.]